MRAGHRPGRLALLAFVMGLSGNVLAEEIEVELAVETRDGRPTLVVTSNSSPCWDEGVVDEKCIYFAGTGEGRGRARITFSLADGGCEDGQLGFRLFDGGFQLAIDDRSFGRPVDQRIVSDFRGAKSTGRLDREAQLNPFGYLATRASERGDRLAIWNQYSAAKAPYTTYYQIYATSCGDGLERRVIALDPRIRNGGDNTQIR